MKIKKINTNRIFFVALFTWMLFMTQSRLGTENYTMLKEVYYILIVVFFGLIALAGGGTVKLRRKELLVYMLVLLPYILLMVLSPIEAFLNGGVKIRSVIRESFLPVAMGLAAIFALRTNRKGIIDAIFYASVINYTVYMVIFTAQFGFNGLLHFMELNDEVTGVTRLLEVHEVTYIFGLLFVYYLMYNRNNQHLKKMAICAVYVFFGNKRILYAALVGTALLYVGLLRKPSSRKIIVSAIILFFMCGAWLLFVTSSYYEPVMNMLGIKLNSRTFSGDGLYARLNSYYTMSLNYWGHGVGFTHMKMIEYKKINGSKTSGFHNDFLKYYIDIGAIPWMLFFGNMTVGIANIAMKKLGKKNAIEYLLLLALTLICWMTDNLATYPNYLFVSMLLYCQVLLGEPEKQYRVTKG